MSLLTLLRFLGASAGYCFLRPKLHQLVGGAWSRKNKKIPGGGIFQNTPGMMVVEGGDFTRFPPRSADYGRPDAGPCGATSPAFSAGRSRGPAPL